MSEEAIRQTRSQKRALEGDPPPAELVDSKRVKLERGEQGDVVKAHTEQVNKVASFLKAGEVKATIKVEVQTGEEPVDMSTPKTDIKTERRPPSPDDVIVLSDNEPSSPCMNGLSHCVKADTEQLMKSSPVERERVIKQLKDELRLQEARLVLLKKLRQSQIQKESTAQKNANSVCTPPPLVRGSIGSGKGNLQVSGSGRSSGTVIPPPLVRGGTQISSKLSSQNTVVMPPLVRGAQPISVTPLQIQNLRQQQQQLSGSGPPPLLLAPRASMPNVQMQGQRVIQQRLMRVANVANTSIMVNISQASPTGVKGSSTISQSGLGSNTSVVSVNDSPASRQAAAKLALRKQLEKTLLEIPPPKPPSPEFNFLPSAANNEFIYLVGLEEVVQNLLDTLARGKRPEAPAPTPAPKEPLTCAQCQTDFTARWRQDKKSDSFLCEQCMSSNQKKALKAEHTGRLKAAFVKALQQEQEIEQHILQQATSSAAKTTSSSSSSSPSSSSPTIVKVDPQALVYSQARASLPKMQQANRMATVNRYHSTVKQSPAQLPRSSAGVQVVGSRSMSHSFPISSQLHSAVSAASAAALARRPGKHAPPARAVSKVTGSGSNPTINTWKKQTTGTTGVTMAYVNPSLSVHKTTSAMDRQREYLLDMIPSRSISQTTNTWK